MTMMSLCAMVHLGVWMPEDKGRKSQRGTMAEQGRVAKAGAVPRRRSGCRLLRQRPVRGALIINYGVKHGSAKKRQHYESVRRCRQKERRPSSRPPGLEHDWGGIGESGRGGSTL